MKKILIVSTVSRQFYLFEQGNIEVLKSLGFEVHGAANFEDANERLGVLDIVRHPFEIQRSPFSFKNIKAYKQLKKIMSSENFDAVHCHSPMGGVLARLAARAVGIKKIIYTAHGFHFYKGAPIKNWIIYYVVEKLLSRVTNVLITINKEDYEIAKNFEAKKVEYIPGIGLDTKKFLEVTVDRFKKREELGIPRDAFVILSVGELNKNKNHEVVLRAFAKLDNSNMFYIICGRGDKQDNLKQLAKSLGIFDKVMFLGFRNDTTEIYKIADIFAFPSYREGLSVSLMEAMSAELPVICSKIRGNTDLIEDGKGGLLMQPDDVDELVTSIEKLRKNTSHSSQMGLYNLRKVKQFDKINVNKIMNKIYSEVLQNEQ